MLENRDDVEKTHRTPRWVKVCGAVAILMVVLFVLKLLFGGGNHGPGRHRPAALGELSTSERGHG